MAIRLVFCIVCDHSVGQRDGLSNILLTNSQSMNAYILLPGSGDYETEDRCRIRPQKQKMLHVKRNMKEGQKTTYKRVLGVWS